MALISPGVQVSVVDESFYTPAEPGTRPLFIVASAANKTPSSGSGTAKGTTAAYAGKVWTITSQRELAETFGDPLFKTDSNNNPIYAGELNEYGLQAAYSFLGVSNSVLVVRANLDLNDLAPQAEPPGGTPQDGTFWLDTANSSFGVFQWDSRDATAGGQAFTNKVPVVALNGVASLSATAATGTYAVVANESVDGNKVKIYVRSAYAANGTNPEVATPSWALVGSDAWAAAWPTVTGTGNASVLGVAVSINSATFTTTGVTLESLVTDITGKLPGVGARLVAGKIEIFSKDSALQAITISETVPEGLTSVLTAAGIRAGTYATPKVTISKHTGVPQYKLSGENRPSGSIWIKTTEPNAGARWRVKRYNADTMLWEQLAAPVYASDLAADMGIDPTSPTPGSNIVINSVYVQHVFDEAVGVPTAEFVVKYRLTSSWSVMSTGVMYFISDTAPATLTADGKLWYNSVVDEVDILVNGEPGEGWKGYRAIGSQYFESVVGNTRRVGYAPIVSASMPSITGKAEGDLWIDVSDLENYPVLRRYNNSFKKWILVDTTDQTTENGVVFADARWNTNGSDAEATIADLLTSNFLDFDAPDPALYPTGMLLWNRRRSGFNVKRFAQNYVNTLEDNRRLPGNPPMANYYPHRWVTESANRADGTGSFGRHAQRKVIIQSLQALVNTNEQVRDTERNSFNLMAAPGYPELIGEMVSLNSARGQTAFIVGDSPARLNPSATTLNNWGTNLAASVEDDESGLVSSDEYLGVFYPWGFTSDNFGRDIAVPPSHMILRMMALNDQVAYPWFAPAGTRRGGITNATAVGYVTAEGDFQSVALNDGQRDTLYNVNVNPITYFTGAGLVNFGQKTRARGTSALDRINVARLVIFLRNQLNKLSKPYIFEPNDKITRDEIKQQVESLLLELVGQRALYDFLVVCDESNNTPNRIDRSELHVDIAIEPVKAVEFIYIPMRLKNTGEIAGLGQ